MNYNPKKHVAQFSLYVPKTNGKLRRERTVHAESREEAIRLWQAFRDEISGKAPAPEPTVRPTVITFGAFVTEYLEKICARRAKKTYAIYRTIAFTRLIARQHSFVRRRRFHGDDARRMQSRVRQQLRPDDESAHEPCSETSAHRRLTADREDPVRGCATSMRRVGSASVRIPTASPRRCALSAFAA